MAKKNGQEKTLFSHIRPKSAIAEAFRTLRTNIGFSSYNGSNKVILITSPASDDGKSTIATNLGIVMAQAQSRVLLVDCDLRKPVLHQYFDLDNRQGLTNLLVQDLAIEDVVYATGVDGLYVIPSGPIPPNPSELLGSPRMAGLLARVAELYDMTLLDAPPVNAVTDAVLLAPQADSVLLVLKSGATHIQTAQEAKNALQNAGAKNIGVVLNETKPQAGGYYNNYYYAEKKPRPVAL
ncbi:MAG: CpsD/CapB family tyrosine-protein kinase [Desulfotomaculaceae bacterium]|nr:CpsD/CapB family tyrosine-protein kinase [Desulfotomaculaceae bacterium]